LIVQESRYSSFATLSRQSSTRDIEKMSQVDEHCAMHNSFGQCKITGQCMTCCTLAQSIHSIRIADNMQDIIPVLFILDMEACNSMDTRSRQHTTEILHAGTRFERLLKGLSNIGGLASQHHITQRFRATIRRPVGITRAGQQCWQNSKQRFLRLYRLLPI